MPKASTVKKLSGQEFEKEFPLLARRRALPVRKAGAFVQPLTGQIPVARIAKSPLLAGAAGTTIWANMAWASTWNSENTHYGMYELNTADLSSFNTLIEDRDIYANAGAALIDGKYYFVYYYNGEYGFNAEKYVYQVDGSTWTKVSDSFIEDKSLIALETACNPTSGQVFGQFYNSDLTSTEFGFIDYEHETRTTVGNGCLHNYVALGITNDNVAYGIDEQYDLYRIDTKTGSETLVGSTGVVLNKPQDYVYFQSGEIDQSTNTFYWAQSDNGGNALYTVDLSTGKATKVCDIDGEFLGMVFPPKVAAAGAPAEVSGLQLDIDGAALSGTLKFTLPTRTVNGAEISGNVKYTVYCNGVNVATRQGASGSAVSESVSLVDGFNTIRVIASNEAGESNAAVLSRYAGYDTPTTPANVNLSLTDNNVTLTWDAPKTGVHDGYIDDLTYTITRMPDNVVVSHNQTATTFSETLPESQTMKSYYYTVTATSHGNTSAAASSASATVGKAIEPNYLEDFNTQSAFDVYTVIDNNNDGATWSWNEYNQSAAYKYSSQNAADDWLITPPIHVKAGWGYTLSFKARQLRSKERLEAKYGYGPNIADLTETIVGPTDVTSNGYTEYKKKITATKDGNLYLGIHAISDADEYYLHVDSIQVIQGANPLAPDSVSNLKVTPGERGAMTAKISFKAPTTTVNGTALDKVNYIYVYNGDMRIQRLRNVDPGEELEVEDDEVETNGINTYRVYASNEAGNGPDNSASAYVGVDLPKAPKNVEVDDNVQTLHMSWDAVGEDGANGGFVNPSLVTYNIYKANLDTYQYDLTTSTGSTQSDISLAQPTNEGDQDLVQYLVSAKNAAGESQMTTGNEILVGKPYTLPFKEGFPNGEAQHFWWQSYGAGSGNTGFAQGTSAEGDNGCAGIQPDEAGYQFSINTGKISLAGATSPKLVYAHKSKGGNGSTIEVFLVKADGTRSLVQTVDYKDVTSDGWVKEVISIPSEYLTEDFIQVHFRLTAGSTDMVLIDDINIADAYANDIAVDIADGQSFVKGTKGGVKVTVSNQGTNTISSYRLKMSAGEDVLADSTFTSNIGSFSRETVTLPYTPSVLSKDAKTAIKVEASIENDGDESNNTASVDVALTEPTVAGPTEGSASANGEDVTLEWTAASNPGEAVTYDIEGYSSWEKDNIGDWTLVDGDGGASGPLVGDTYLYGDYANVDIPFAYTVFNPYDLTGYGYDTSDLVEESPCLKPHSGNQYLAAVYSYDSSTDENLPADNWLISPELGGQEQTVSFYVNNYAQDTEDVEENFEVLYSLTTKDTTAFIPIPDADGSTVRTISGGNWTKVEAALPAGAKYFAIRHCTSDDPFFFTVDDITYYVGGGNPTAYNVYVDGKLVGTTPESPYTVEGGNDGNDHEYAVTAVYGDSESAPLYITLTSTGINNVVSVSTPQDIYTLGGILVRKNATTLKGLKPGTYVTNGRKFSVK